MNNTIKVLFDNQEYFVFKSLVANHNTDRNMAMKQARLSAVSTSLFRDFIVELNTKTVMLAQVFVNDKLYLEGYINQDSLDYRDSASSGTDIDIIINDRFFPLKQSDIIKTKPTGSLQNFIANILKELGFADEKYIGTYQKQIQSTADFIKFGVNIESQKIKSFAREDLVEKDAISLIGEALSLSHLILISNGYDTVNIEKINSYLDPIFLLTRSNLGCNIDYAEKTNNNQNAPTPAKVVILNSSDSKDNNSSVVFINNNGLPHVQKVHHLSVDASYQDIANSLNFSFSGIKARANSFLYKCQNIIFDIDNNFFQPNRAIRVVDEKYGIDEIMVIMQVGFTIDATNGTELTLNITTPEAFDSNASIKQKRALMNR